MLWSLGPEILPLVIEALADPENVRHAPDGLRARAATALGCVQAGAEKLGVIQANYASAIIGVLGPLSSR